MRAKDLLKTGIDYAEFDDPYSGLAAMVFVQAASDLVSLKGREYCRRDGYQIRKWEIVNFFRSEWAASLAEEVNLDIRDAIRYSNRIAGIQEA